MSQRNLLRYTAFCIIIVLCCGMLIAKNRNTSLEIPKLKTIQTVVPAVRESLPSKDGTEPVLDPIGETHAVLEEHISHTREDGYPRSFKKTPTDSVVPAQAGIHAVLNKPLDDNNITIPEYFYKVILNYGKEPHALGYLIPQNTEEKDYKIYTVPVDTVEKATGIDFFPSLDDKEEKRVEKF